MITTFNRRNHFYFLDKNYSIILWDKKDTFVVVKHSDYIFPFNVQIQFHRTTLRVLFSTISIRSSRYYRKRLFRKQNVLRNENLQGICKRRFLTLSLLFSLSLSNTSVVKKTCANSFYGSVCKLMIT